MTAETVILAVWIYKVDLRTITETTWEQYEATTWLRSRKREECGDGVRPVCLWNLGWDIYVQYLVDVFLYGDDNDAETTKPQNYSERYLRSD